MLFLTHTECSEGKACRRVEISTEFVFEKGALRKSPDISLIFSYLQRIFANSQIDIDMVMLPPRLFNREILARSETHRDVPSDESEGEHELDAISEEARAVRDASSVPTPSTPTHLIKSDSLQYAAGDFPIRKHISIYIVEDRGREKFSGASRKYGIFQMRSSVFCAIRRTDSPLAAAGIIGHEIAHLLGSSHDGDANACSKGYLMQPVYGSTASLLRMSPCSVRSVKNTLAKIACAKRR